MNNERGIQPLIPVIVIEIGEWLEKNLPRVGDMDWILSPMSGSIEESGYHIRTSDKEKMLHLLKSSGGSVEVFDDVYDYGFGILKKGWVVVDSVDDIVLSLNGVMIKIVDLKK